MSTDIVAWWQDFLSFYRIFILPYGLSVIMFGMGLTLTPADFRRIAKTPRASAIGITGQLVVLPLIAIALSVVLPLPALIAFSLVLVSACPGGVSSNAIVFIIRGDTALSISLTAISSMLAIITVPLVVNAGLMLHYGQQAEFSLPLGHTLQSLLSVAIIPVVLGMAILHFAPPVAKRLAAFLHRISGYLLLFIVAIGTLAAVDFAVAELLLIYVACQALAVIVVVLGFVASRFGGLPRSQQATIAIELGLQNVALAMLIANQVLERPEVAVLPGVYGVVMFLTILPVVCFYKKRAEPGVLLRG